MAAIAFTGFDAEDPALVAFIAALSRDIVAAARKQVKTT
jgi:hypothetical protein